MATQNLYSVQLPAVETSFVYHYHVAPNGTATASGRIDDPWSLEFAIGGAGGKIKPGHHIAVHGGTYKPVSSISFTTIGLQGIGVDDQDGKIIFRNWPKERPRIQTQNSGVIDTLKVFSNYTWLWGLEFYDSGYANRNFAPHHTGGLTMQNGLGNGNKYIHCVVHDYENNVAGNDGANRTDKVEMYGCIFYNGGVEGSGNGHNLYMHHSGSATATWYLDNCISFNSFGLLAQFFGASEQNEWFKVLNNIWFGGGALSSGTNPYGHMIVFGGQVFNAHNIVYSGNMLYGADKNARTIRIGGGGATDGPDTFEVANNYHVGGGSSAALTFFDNVTAGLQNTINVHDNLFKQADSKQVISISDTGALSYVWTNNEWHHINTSGFDGVSWASFMSTTGLGGTDTQINAAPSVTKVFVKPTNKFERGRGHVAFYNWANTSTVTVDLAPILAFGDNFNVYDVRDLFNPVLTGLYSGTTCQFPTTQVPDPIPTGGSVAVAPDLTTPLFNAFLVTLA